MKSIKSLSKRALLVICDGMGESENTNKNAVKDAKTPNLDFLKSHFPFTTVVAGGELVGLPNGVAGNSEVGHLNIGAGRSIRQDLVRINEAIDNNTFKDMEEFKKLIQSTLNGSKRLHLMGLLSDGGVHSHINHLKAILDILKNHPQIEVHLHAFMDGRDTQLDSGKKYLSDILNYGGFTFASMQGRSIGMDRDRRWPKIKDAYDMMTGKKSIESKSPSTYLESQYQNEIFDEFITPALFNSESAIKSDDSVFFFNFRPDRAKQISEVFCSDHFKEFKNDIRPHYFLCMSPYIDEEFPKVPILFNREKVKGTVIEYLSSLNLKTFKIAETEKYAHVTYFFNGGEEEAFNGEDRVLIESPKDVKRYSEKPQMSAPKVLTALIDKLKDKSISFYVVNFANPDMVGHTGEYEAAVLAMQEVDHCIGELMKVIDNQEDLTMMITADHGNCDMMVYEDGSKHTSHSNSDVPFIVYNKDLKDKDFSLKKGDKALMDISPTALNIMGIDKPESMIGSSVFL